MAQERRVANRASSEIERADSAEVVKRLRTLIENYYPYGLPVDAVKVPFRYDEITTESPAF